MGNGPSDPPAAERWSGREELWEWLSRFHILVATADPARSGHWRVFETAGNETPYATLTDDEVHDLTVAGVIVVYRH